MTDRNTHITPFRLPLRSRLLGALAENLLGLSGLRQLYGRLPKGAGALVFLEALIRQLGANIEISDTGLAMEAIPQSGPLLVVANHPLGGLEGIVLAAHLLRRRPDVKVLVNNMLTRIPELSDIFIGVDILGKGPSSANVGGLKQAQRHLASGGALVVFPAGMVASFNLSQRSVVEAAWTRFVGHLAKNVGTTCLPVHLGGSNSIWFYLAGLIHRRLRTILLPREFLGSGKGKLTITIGSPVKPQEYQGLDSAQTITDYLRLITLELAHSTSTKSRSEVFGQKAGALVRHASSRDVAALADCRLIEHQRFDVYCVPYGRLGALMDEIAVARAASFAAAGEGSGEAKDQDHFDHYYRQLFLWDKQDGRVAGGYRIGQVDKIVQKHGVAGLYSRSLYTFGDGFINRLGDALELGRSFILPDYQRSPVALDLLWRGIGRVVAQNPQYHTLFGTVSVSRDYSDLARTLIAQALFRHYPVDSELVAAVEPMRPLNARSEAKLSAEFVAQLGNLKMLNSLIGRCDSGRAIPILIRHYLMLGGRFAGFHVDAQFGDTLTGLIIVDLRNTPHKYLKRYLGDEGMKNFIKTWKLKCAA